MSANRVKKLTADLVPGRATAPKPNRYKAKKALIAARFYYYVVIEQVTYTQAIEKMDNDFFISPKQLTAIITEEEAAIRALREQNRDKSWLRSHWPSMAW